MRKYVFIILLIVVYSTGYSQNYYPNYTIGIPVNDTLFNFSWSSSRNCSVDTVQLTANLETAISGLKFYVLVDNANGTVVIPPFGVVHKGDSLPIFPQYTVYLSYPSQVKLLFRVKGTPLVANQSYSCGMGWGDGHLFSCKSIFYMTYTQTCTVNSFSSVGSAPSINNNIFIIYPNPLTSSSILQLTASVKDAEVSIYNMLGKEMLKKKLTGNKMEIEKGNMESGVYFVRLHDGEKQYTQKLIIQ